MPFTIKEYSGLVTDPIGTNNSRNIVRTPDSHIHAIYWGGDLNPSMYHAESADEGQSWFEQSIEDDILDSGHSSIARDLSGNIYATYQIKVGTDFRIRRAYKPFLEAWQVLSIIPDRGGISAGSTINLYNPSLVVDLDSEVNCFYANREEDLGGSFHYYIVRALWTGNGDVSPTPSPQGFTSIVGGSGGTFNLRNYPAASLGNDGDIWCVWQETFAGGQKVIGLWNDKVAYKSKALNIVDTIDLDVSKPSVTTGLNNRAYVTAQSVVGGTDQIHLFELYRDSETTTDFFAQSLILANTSILTGDASAQTNSVIARDSEGKIFVFFEGIPDGGTEKKVRFVASDGLEFGDINNFAAGKGISVADSIFSSSIRGLYIILIRDNSVTCLLFGQVNIWGQNRPIVKVGNFPDYKRLHTLTDSSVISLYNASRVKDFPLDWVRDDATAQAFAYLQLIRLNRRPFDTLFSLPLLGIDVEEGDTLSLDHHILDALFENGNVYDGSFDFDSTIKYSSLRNDFEVITVLRDADKHRINLVCKIRGGTIGG